MKQYIRFLGGIFAGVVLVVSLLWLFAGWQPVASAAEMSALPINQATATLPVFFTQTVDVGTGGRVGLHTSLALNDAGNPVISHYDLFYGDLKVAVCQDAACTNVISTTVDSVGDVGEHTSLALDAAGNPVISYHANGVKIAICQDAACTNVISTTVDSVGGYPFLTLNDAGNPVISYYDWDNDDLKLAVCQDAVCNSIISTTVDSIGDAGMYSSLELNADGNPVISYYDVTNNDLKVAVCQDATCTNVISTTVDSSVGSVGEFTFLKLNTVGNPVISYLDSINRDLKLAVCQDATCTSVISTTIQSVGFVDEDTSLELNAAGNPVISYYDDTNNDLKVAVCQDAVCSSVISTTLDSAGDVGSYSSLALNAAGNPVISYFDWTNYDLKVVVCGDVTCSSVGTTITTVDAGIGGDVGKYTSLALNAAGNPVISHYDQINGDLKVAICRDAACTNVVSTAVDSVGDVGGYSSLELNADGNPVISYWDRSNNNLKLAVCQDAACANVVSNTLDSSGGMYTSLELNAAGNPVISYYARSSGDLKVAVCQDAICTSVISTTVDSVGNVGGPYGVDTSLELNAVGNPVISYYDDTNYDLKLAVCQDAVCTSVISTTVDSVGDVGRFSSLKLNADGNPVISYHVNGDLKLAVCQDAVCTSVISTTVDSWNVRGYTSLELNPLGNPVISYYGAFSCFNTDLKVAVCQNTICTNVLSTTLDSIDDVGSYSSLELNAAGNPVISYRDYTNGDLKIAGPLNTCFTEYTGDSITDFASADMMAVQNAIDAAVPGSTVKVAGYCPGVQSVDGYTQAVRLSKALTLEGGYTMTAWTDAPDLNVNSTILDAQGRGSVVYVDADGAVLSNLNIVNGLDVNGAGIYVASDARLIVESCFVADNRAIGQGGGVFNAGQVYISESTFISNSAGWGGGLANTESSVITINQSSLRHNTATNDGGAIYNQQASCLTLVNSTVYSNAAGTGGGLLNNGALTVTNSTLSENAAVSGGGGLHLNAGSGIYLRNTIVANSVTGSDCENYDESALLVVNDSNLIADNTCSPQYSGDPRLGSLGLYGGATEVLPLLSGSTAIDKGNGAVCSAIPVNSVDQRGVARPQGLYCDIGAYEWSDVSLYIYLPLVIR